MSGSILFKAIYQYPNISQRQPRQHPIPQYSKGSGFNNKLFLSHTRCFGKRAERCHELSRWYYHRRNSQRIAWQHIDCGHTVLLREEGTWFAPTPATTMSAAPTAAPTELPRTYRSRGKQTYCCRDCLPRFTPGGNRHSSRQPSSFSPWKYTLGNWQRHHWPDTGGPTDHGVCLSQKSRASGGVGAPGSPAPGGPAAGAATGPGNCL